jgi:Predicted dehydrogenases and related proteins
MTVKFGIIGLGNRGYKYALRTIQAHKDVEIKMVCDALGHHFDLFPGVLNTTDYREVLANPEVDAIFIATPDDTHAEIILAAIEADKHILCEKPLEISDERITLIEEKLQGYNKVFEVGYVLRYARTFSRVKDFLTSGIIGRVIMADVIDHIQYGGYAYFHDWHRTRAKATSLLLQKATHSLDLINWYLDSDPKNVVAFGDLAVFGEVGAIEKFGRPVPDTLHCHECEIRDVCEESIQNLAKEKNINWSDNWPDSCVFNSEIDVDDHQTVMIRYENGAKATYQLCQFAAYYKREFHFFGTKGELYFDDVTNQIVIHDRLKAETLTYDNQHLEQQMEPGDEEQLADFLAAINTGKSPVSNLTSSVQAGRLALAAQRSIDQETIEHI